eukprot:XP_011664614.1 PREDICTED: uncharacterized protein LOC105438475 [Strongylocentrotus purpuratus]
MADSSTAGSGRMLSLTDMKLNEIGEALGDNENLMTLGLHLGFPQSKVKMFLATNRADGNVSPKGTKNMLFAWRNKTSSANQVKNLREALVKADLKLVADEHLRDLQ